MKKALALVMAIAMVASMAAVSFAASAVVLDKVTNSATPAGKINALWDAPFYYDGTASVKAMKPVDGSAAYGTTLYFVLYDANGNFVTESKTVENLKVSGTWDEGGAYVSGVEIVRKTSAGVDSSAGKYLYYLAVSTTGSETSTKEVYGKVLFEGRSGDNKDKIKHTAEVNFNLGYKTGSGADVDDKTLKVWDLSKEAVLADGTFTLEFEDKFDVTVKAAARETGVILAADSTVIEEIEAAYPDANIDFYALTGAFKKTATVVVELEEGEEFLYAVVDGEVVEVNGEYDDWAEEFTFKTKKLGTYIISDVELELAEEVVATNPSTGAAA